MFNSKLQPLLPWLSLLISTLFMVVRCEVGTASMYNPPYTPSACYGDDASQFPSSNLFAAAGEAIWANGAGCGRQYLVRCISASIPRTCIPGQTIQVRIVDRARTSVSRPTRADTTMVLSDTAFSTIANQISSINIEFQQYCLLPPPTAASCRRNPPLRAYFSHQPTTKIMRRIWGSRRSRRSSSGQGSGQGSGQPSGQGSGQGSGQPSGQGSGQGSHDDDEPVLSDPQVGFEIGTSSGQESHHDDTSIPDMIPHNPDSRKFITAYGNDFTKGAVTRAIGKIVRRSIDGPWGSFLEIPLQNRRLMWERFEGMYRWHPNNNSAVINAYEYRAKKLYSGALYEARTAAIEQFTKATGAEFNPLDMSGIIPYNPGWIPEEHWRTLVGRWNTDEWRARSNTAHENRNTMEDGSVSKHCAGSKSFLQYATEMKKEKGRVYVMDLFDRTHRKRSSEDGSSSSGGASSRTGEYMTPKAGRVAGGYTTLSTQKFGDDLSTHPPIDPGIWDSVTGGWTKGRLYGFGQFPDPEYMLGSTASGPDPYQQPTHDTRNIDELLRERDAAHEARVAKMEEQMRDQRNEMTTMRDQINEMTTMRDHMTEMMRSLGYHPPPPPPPQ